MVLVRMHFWLVKHPVSMGNTVSRRLAWQLLKYHLFETFKHMSKKFSSMVVLAVATLAGAITAQATPITGGVVFQGGTFVANNDLANATGFSSISSSTVLAGNGSYSSLSGNLVNWTAFDFKPSLNPNPVTLWSFSDLNTGFTYSFSATSVIVVQQNSGFLSLMGHGVARITGIGSTYSNTEGSWTLTSTGPVVSDGQGGRTLFAFGSGANVPVPDGGATLSLLGISICSLGLFRKKYLA